MVRQIMQQNMGNFNSEDPKTALILPAVLWYDSKYLVPFDEYHADLENSVWNTPPCTSIKSCTYFLTANFLW